MGVSSRQLLKSDILLQFSLLSAANMWLGILMLAVLSRIHHSEKPRLGKNCSFFTFGKYIYGNCTFYGACRVAERDFMYQGGCGEISLWGQKIIQGEQGCKIWTNDGKDVHVGSCSVAGHCVDGGEVVSYNNPYCQAAVLTQNRTQAHTNNNNTSLVHKNQNQRRSNFMETLFYFLGGLGNALRFTSFSIWT